MDEMNNIPQNEEIKEAPAYEAEPAAESVVVAEEAPQKKFDGLGLAAMICSIASLLLCSYMGFGIVAAIVGLILGCVAKPDPATGNKSGMAKTGIILGAISIGLNIISMIVWIVAIIGGEMASGMDFDYSYYM